MARVETHAILNHLLDSGHDCLLSSLVVPSTLLILGHLRLPVILKIRGSHRRIVLSVYYWVNASATQSIPFCDTA